MSQGKNISRRKFLETSATVSLATGISPDLTPLMNVTTSNPSQHNIIIFMPDQLRAESIECYGHPLVKTPNMDALAAQGTRFAHCQSAYPVCTAARCSMMTGWPPHVRGHRSVYYLLQPDEPNLFRYLKNNGYDVYWYGKNDLLVHEIFEESVTHWNYFAEGPEWSGKDNPWAYDDPYYFTFLFGEGRDRTEYPDYQRVQAAIKVLEATQRERPFCIFLPLFFPHPPFTGPKGFHSMYHPDDIPHLRPGGLTGKPPFYEAIRRSRRLDQLQEADFRKINAVYLGMISYTDWLLGELLEALDKTNHSKDTVVFFCSDHGEWAGDYGLVEKWSAAMDDPILKVPLIVRHPEGKTGHIVDGLVELYDVMATCLEIAGVIPDHTHFARNLLPQIMGNPGDPDRAVFSEGGYNTYELQAFEPLEMFPKEHIYYPKIWLENTHPEMISRTTTIRSKNYKLTLRPDSQSEFYDLTKDPQELYNLYGDPAYAEQQTALKIQLLDWYIRTSDVVPVGRDQRGMPRFTSEKG